MNTNKENFLKLVSGSDTTALEQIKERKRNRARLRESQLIALKVLNKLDELGWSQSRLAKEMDVLPQQITKIVRGKENLTLDTLVKLEQVLDIPILATYYEKIFEHIDSLLKFAFSEHYLTPENKQFEANKNLQSKSYQMRYDAQNQEYECYQELA